MLSVMILQVHISQDSVMKQLRSGG